MQASDAASRVLVLETARSKAGTSSSGLSKVAGWRFSPATRKWDRAFLQRFDRRYTKRPAFHRTPCPYTGTEKWVPSAERRGRRAPLRLVALRLSARDKNLLPPSMNFP